MNEKQKPPPPRLEDVPPGDLIRVGGSVNRATVSLRLIGDNLEPDEVTNRLGCQPTAGSRKGDVIPDSHYHRIARTGSWRLDGADDRSTDLERQVTNLLKRVTNDLAIWQDLSSRLKVDLFCGVFLDEFNRGFTFSPGLLRQIADRGIEIGFDIYGA